jgi:hypothetical protein
VSVCVCVVVVVGGWGEGGVGGVEKEHITRRGCRWCGAENPVDHQTYL